MEPTIIGGPFLRGGTLLCVAVDRASMFIPARVRGTVTRRAYGSRNLFVGVSWKREDCWNGGICKDFLGCVQFYG